MVILGLFDGHGIQGTFRTMDFIFACSLLGFYLALSLIMYVVVGLLACI